jgi:HSP20 family molecular chaperone IbpA
LPKTGVKEQGRTSRHIGSALAETERLLAETQRRALNVFYDRGILDRDQLQKWLDGPEDACWRVVGIVEREKDFVVSIALPGVDAGFMELTREPRPLIVRTAPSREWTVPRKLNLPVDWQSDKLAAFLKEGNLVIMLPKAER